jgi:hypothetical protein
MPSYTFQTRFVPFVKDGTKRHTIRKIRKHPCKPGKLISHFTGPRFKPVRIIDKQSCLQVQTIIITADGECYLLDAILNQVEGAMLLEDPALPPDLLPGKYIKLNTFGKDRLAWHDGFRHQDKPTSFTGCFDIMLNWWKQTHELPFIGHLIKW